jgi:hypothetical protein
LQFRAGPKVIANDSFHWVSSGKSFPLKYGGWAPYDPDRSLNDGEYQSCIAVKSLGRIIDYDCNKKIYSLCQQLFP